MPDGKPEEAAVPIEAIREPALLIDAAGVIRAANARARALLLGGAGGGAGAGAGPSGSPPAPAAEQAAPSIVGRALRDLLAFATHEEAPFGSGEIEARLPGPDARRITLGLGRAPGGALVAILRDRTREDCAFQLRLAREKFESISQLAAGVAHEFNNIMASLYGFAQLARQDPQFFGELIGAVEQSAERSREVTRRLLSLSPEQFSPLVPVDLAELLEDVAARHAPALARAHIRLVTSIEPGLPQTLGARAELDEAFDALVENARVAVVKNGEVEIAAARDGPTILVRVRDTGFGIPRENLTRVFEPFFVTKATEGGGRRRDGLGLAIAYSHVRRHGGEIWVESEIGKGTTFFVRLPVRAERRRKTVEVPVDRRRAPGVQARRILVVDDEESMLRLLESILAPHQVAAGRRWPRCATAPSTT